MDRPTGEVIDNSAEASLWSRLAVAAYWTAIALVFLWVLTTKSLSTREVVFLVVIGVLAGALPMEKRAAGLRLKAMSWQINYDPLTRLHNRAYFMSQLSQRLQKRRNRRLSLAVLILDLDRFKNVNDTLGHAAGDELLREVGERLTRAIPSHLIARLGGDEFGVLAEVTGEEALRKLGERLVQTLNFRTIVGGQPVWVNTSVGAAIASVPRPTLVELLSRADTALYQAKAAGRNQVAIFEANRFKPALSELSMDYELRMAMVRDQLSLYYQPVIDLRTGLINGFEALLRWSHPTLGFVSPDRFIPLAEENGLIQEIGKWVLEEACRQAAEWHLVFSKQLTMSINLSALQFARGDIATEVNAILEQTGVAPESIHLEITETALGQDESNILHNIADLKQLGVSLSVDDFGIGYSSLNYLRKYPADFLKIDKSFVDEIIEQRSYGVIKAAIDVGHVLGMQIIAEGVETPEQLRLLTMAGADFGQGYLFHKPMSPAEITGILLAEMGRSTSPLADAA